MTIRTMAMQTCDRCLKPFNEKHLKSGDAVPIFKQRGLVVTETTGLSKDPEPKFNVLFSFDDLCPDCQNAVLNLLDKIRLEAKPDNRRQVPAKKRSAKKQDKPAKAPEVGEYEENVSVPVSTPASTPAPRSVPVAREAKVEDPGEVESVKVDEPTEEQVEKTKGTRSRKREAAANVDNDNGKEAVAEPEGLITDPVTGDKYDPTTGEVVVRGNLQEAHPF